MAEGHFLLVTQERFVYKHEVDQIREEMHAHLIVFCLYLG